MERGEEFDLKGDPSGPWMEFTLAIIIAIGIWVWAR